jgi:polysaccharide deacetylase 2 family uncharacterized protein YibQ
VGIVFDQIKERDLFFLDSLTTRKSVCEKIAGKKKLLYARRDIFLDEEPGEEYIKAQMKKVEQLARTKGYAIAVGHERSATLNVLLEVIPEMKDRGIKFVLLSEIVEKVNGEQ